MQHQSIYSFMRASYSSMYIYNRIHYINDYEFTQTISIPHMVLKPFFNFKTRLVQLYTLVNQTLTIALHLTTISHPNNVNNNYISLLLPTMAECIKTPYHFNFGHG